MCAVLKSLSVFHGIGLDVCYFILKRISIEREEYIVKKVRTADQTDGPLNGVYCRDIVQKAGKKDFMLPEEGLGFTFLEVSELSLLLLLLRIVSGGRRS